MSERTFHLFVYGTLRTGGGAAAVLDGATRVREAVVQGTLYDIDGRFPVLVFYDGGSVTGEIWRCPVAMLARLDEYEDVTSGLFRRRGVEIDGTACWVYVAGPRLASKLTPQARIPGGDWLNRSEA